MDVLLKTIMEIETSWIKGQLDVGDASGKLKSNRSNHNAPWICVIASYNKLGCKKLQCLM